MPNTPHRASKHNKHNTLHVPNNRDMSYNALTQLSADTMWQTFNTLKLDHNKLANVPSVSATTMFVEPKPNRPTQ